MRALDDGQRLRPIPFDRIAEAVQGTDPGIAAPGEGQAFGTPHADHLVADQIGCHADQMQPAAALTNDLVTGGKRDQMREALERHALTVAHVLRDGIGKRHQRHGVLLDHGL